MFTRHSECGKNPRQPQMRLIHHLSAYTATGEIGSNSYADNVATDQPLHSICLT